MSVPPCGYRALTAPLPVGFNTCDGIARVAVNPDALSRDECVVRSRPRLTNGAMAQRQKLWCASSGIKDKCMFSRRDTIKCGALALLAVAATPAAWAQETKTDLFKVITVKDEIIIGLSADELKVLGGSDASAVAHALAQKGDMAVWQYNVHRGQNGELQQAPTAKIGLIASSSLRVEPYTTPYVIVQHQ
jgi:hypothetical protein